LLGQRLVHDTIDIERNSSASLMVDIHMIRNVVFIFAALLASVTGAAKERAADTFAIGRPLELAGGQRLELLQVTDSRCALGARCDHRGHVTLLLHWRSQSSADPMRMTLADSTVDGQAKAACLNGILVQIRNVTPLPRPGQSIAQADYEVTVSLATCANEQATS
jgi:hypothetical protein